MGGDSGPSAHGASQKRKGEAGAKSDQKHKFYKRHEGGRGRGGGRRGRGRGRGRGADSSAGQRHGENDEGTGEGSSEGGGRRENRPHSLTKYRDGTLPEILTSPGICVTTVQHKERAAEEEFMQYLEQVADEVYPDTMEAQVENNPDEDIDFEEMLKRDLEAIGGEKKKSTRFRLCLHEVICVVHVIVLPPLDPLRLVRHILEQSERTGRFPLKFCKRLLPISATSPATLSSLSEAAKSVVGPGFTTPDDHALKFGIITNSRNSDKLEKMDVIRTIAEEVTKLGKGHGVDLKNPDRTIVVELHKNTLGIAVLQDYERFKKYNPSSVAAAAAQRSILPSTSEMSGANTSNPSQGSGSRDMAAEAARRLANRSRKAAEFATQGQPQPQPQASDNKPLDGGEDDVEEGQVLPSIRSELEKGEVVEHPKDALKEEEVEVIVDGKVLRSLKSDDDDNA